MVIDKQRKTLKYTCKYIITQDNAFFFWRGGVILYLDFLLVDEITKYQTW